MSRKGSLTASVTVKNTGSRKGDEVVQVYIHDPVATISQPVRRLRGFERLTLNPGEARTVEFCARSQRLRLLRQPRQVRRRTGPDRRVRGLELGCEPEAVIHGALVAHPRAPRFQAGALGLRGPALERYLGLVTSSSSSEQDTTGTSPRPRPSRPRARRSTPTRASSPASPGGSHPPSATSGSHDACAAAPARRRGKRCRSRPTGSCSHRPTLSSAPTARAKRPSSTDASSRSRSSARTRSPTSPSSDSTRVTSSRPSSGRRAPSGRPARGRDRKSERPPVHCRRRLGPRSVAPGSDPPAVPPRRERDPDGRGSQPRQLGRRALRRPGTRGRHQHGRRRRRAGLAVPIDSTTRKIVGALMSEGRFRRAYIGIAGGSRPLPPRMAAQLQREAPSKSSRSPRAARLPRQGFGRRT